MSVLEAFRRLHPSKEAVEIVKKGGQDAIDYVTEHPDSINLTTRSFSMAPETLIDIAIEHGHDELVKVMCCILKKNEPTFSFIRHAATAVCHNRCEILEMLILEYDVKRYIDESYLYRVQECFLHIAAMSDTRNDALKMLLSHGADCNVIDYNRNTALYNAVFCGAVNNVKELLKAGANTLFSSKDVVLKVTLKKDDVRYLFYGLHYMKDEIYDLLTLYKVSGFEVVGT